MHRITDLTLSEKAKEFLNEFKAKNIHTHLHDILSAVSQGLLISPDDWALVQETLDHKHPCAVLFNQQRNYISRQFIYEGRNCTAVPIITFTHADQTFILLMKNLGLANSEKVQEIQWTAHGVRIDSDENQFVSKERWEVYASICDQETPVHFIAAAVRRLETIGINLNLKEILNIHLVDRAGAGFPEMDAKYKTEYLHIDLGERDPTEIIHQIKSKKTRYASWTECFNLSALKSNITEVTNITPADKRIYQLSYQGEIIPVRNTTWFFILALQFVKEKEVTQDDFSKDPWFLRNLNSIEIAISWIRRRTDSPVQITLLSESNNRLNSAQVHAYSARARINEEDFAYTSLKPQRFILHSLIAHLTILVKFENSEELELILQRIHPNFLKLHPDIFADCESKFIEMQIENSKTYRASVEFKNLLSIINETVLTDKHKVIYNLNESNEQIAEIILLHKKYNKFLKEFINVRVKRFIDVEIASGQLTKLTQYNLVERQCFGITGPVASGKSVSEKMIRDYLGSKDAAYIGSDEWNVILSEYMNLPHQFSMQRGKLTLAEAWYIKVLIWDLMRSMEKELSRAPNWIQETCDPSSVNFSYTGSMSVYINTADPSAAPQRVKERGDKSGRYVSATVASSSYRWTWLNFLTTLEKINKNSIKNIELRVIDTDVIYQKQIIKDRKGHANIATFKNGILDIHNFVRFVLFIERSYRVNANPKNRNEIWLDNKRDLTTTLSEIKKLFNTSLNIVVRYKHQQVSQENLFNLINNTTFILPETLAFFARKRIAHNHVANTPTFKPNL